MKMEHHEDKSHTHSVIVLKPVLENPESPVLVEIIPETVGQYTGLNDKNGKEIYEGDIILWGDDVARKEGTAVNASIIWSGGGFCIKAKEYTHELWHYGSRNWNDMPYAKESEKMNIYQYFRNSIEVIGNIHDNPKLIKK
jgi:uncharacterized phage protein (TIGR01671 family)